MCYVPYEYSLIITFLQMVFAIINFHDDITILIIESTTKNVT